MEFRRNIIFSAVLHAMIIIAVFAVSVSVRDMTERFCTDYLTVSLFKETTGTTSVNFPVPVPDNKTRFLTNAQTCPETGDSSASPQNDKGRKNDKSEETASKNSSDKVDIIISANQHAGISEETNILHSILKENESNPPSPPFSKGGMGGLLEQNSASQNTGKSQSGDEILESTKRMSSKGDMSPYDLIRAAIEKAKTYPFLARKKKIEGTVITGFTINAKGNPQDIKIEKSSGSEILDSAAIKIVMKASPFPVVNGEIVVPISFKLTNYPPSYISSR